MIILIIFTVISVFFIGLLMGIKCAKKKETKILAKQKENLQIIETEYQNFLNYDGSVQQ